MSSDLSLISYYAQRAGEYERIYQKPERQADLRRLHTRIASEFTGASVLEVACGTGYWTEVLARSASTVVATDINEEVLAIARAKSLGPQVTFLRTDAYALPAWPRPCDAGFSAFWWSHVPLARQAEFLRGFHSGLAPGARVVLLDNRYVDGSSTPISRRDERGNTYQIRRLADGSTHEVLKNFPTAEELKAAVQDRADKVQVELLEYYWVLSYVVPPAPEADPKITRLPGWSGWPSP